MQERSYRFNELEMNGLFWVDAFKGSKEGL